MSKCSHVRSGIRIVSADRAGVSGNAHFGTSRIGSNRARVALVLTFRYNVSAVLFVSNIFFFEIITDIRGEISSGNYRNTVSFSKYIAGRIFGGGISNGKFTAADINSTVEGIYVTVNRLKGTALDSGSSPVTDQIIIRRCGKATVFNGKRTCSSNADTVNIFEVEGSALDSKVSANYHCVCIFIDILYVKRYTAKIIPIYVAFNNDLLENHNNVTDICRRDGILESSVVCVSNISES